MMNFDIITHKEANTRVSAIPSYDEVKAFIENTAFEEANTKYAPISKQPSHQSNANAHHSNHLDPPYNKDLVDLLHQ